jgi:hypothetical protein
MESLKTAVFSGSFTIKYRNIIASLKRGDFRDQKIPLYIIFFFHYTGVPIE